MSRRPRIRRLLSWIGIEIPELDEQALLAYLDELCGPVDASATGAAPQAE